MTFLDKQYWARYAFATIMILIAGTFGNKIKEYLDTDFTRSDFKLIRNYLLNDDEFFASSKPPLWIHTTYSRNSRQWESFGSRASYDLNQPYLHFTIKSLIMENSDDFNICLIDDDSFARLLPNDWNNIDMENAAEPFKNHYRQMGFLKLIHTYGGIVVPNSFLCMRNLSVLYQQQQKGKPFVAEFFNKGGAGRISASTGETNSMFGMELAPDVRFIGARGKNDPVIKELIDEAEMLHSSGQFTSEKQFFGGLSRFCVRAIKNRQMKLLGAENVGVISAEKKLLLLDNWMTDDYVHLIPDVLGIWIDSDEILKRPKYQWFAVLPVQEIVNEGTYALSKWFIWVADKMQNKCVNDACTVTTTM